MRPLASALALAVATSSPALAADRDSPVPLPPYTGAYQPQTVDERGVWMIADEDERNIRDSAFVIRDPALDAYVRRVLCRTVGDDRCRGVRIYILRTPYFNATMMPNGTLQLWSGMLLRMRDEAELAGILGHEFAHFEQRHSLKKFRQHRLASDIIAWTGVIGGRYAPGIQRSAVGAAYAFGRAQETEADLLSARYLQSAKYDGHCFADVWMRLMDEADAIALGRRQRSSRYDRVAFFASHPTDQERARYLTASAASLPPGGDDNRAAFAAALAPWRAAFLEDQLKLNDFGGTEYLLDQLARDGWTEDLIFARAELYRMRGYARDLVAAADFYRRAIALDPAHAEAHRGLGLSLLRVGTNADAGRDALRRYLELKPNATDAAMMAALIS